jgi:pilus assembly protein CpaF
MSLLDHLRTAKAPPPASVLPPVAEPAPPGTSANGSAPAAEPTPAASAVVEATLPSRVTRSPARNEATLELKARVHEELIREIDPEQLTGDTGFNSAVRRAVEQAAEERITVADPTLGRQERMRLASEIADEVLGFGPLEPLLRDH